MLDKILAEQKLLENCKITDTGCWEWTRAKDNWGYGVLKLNGRQYKANRISLYVYQNLSIDDPEELALHKCSNKACFNPEHLYIGDNYDNIQDTLMDGNWKCPRPKGIKLGKPVHFKCGHPTDTSNVYRSPDGRTVRCKECNKNHVNRYAERKRRGL